MILFQISNSATNDRNANPVLSKAKINHVFCIKAHMEYTDNQIAIIKRAGAIKFSLRQILYLLPELNPIEFRKDFEDENHIVHKTYHSEKCQADMEINEALQLGAKKGDTFSAELIDKKQFYNKITEMKQDYFGIL